jgi:hypothetical protein
MARFGIPKNEGGKAGGPDQDRDRVPVAALDLLITNQSKR